MIYEVNKCAKPSCQFKCGMCFTEIAQEKDYAELQADAVLVGTKNQWRQRCIKVIYIVTGNIYTWSLPTKCNKFLLLHIWIVYSLTKTSNYG